MSHSFVKSEWFFNRVEKIREALSDYQEQTGQSSEEILLPVFWAGANEERRRNTATLATELIELLGESQTTWPQKPEGAEKRMGLTQKQIAQMIEMSESAMTALKNGTGSAATINRLVTLAIIRGVEVPKKALDFAEILDNMPGMVRAMKKVVELIGWKTTAPLDESTYRCLRAALDCGAWHRARDGGNMQEEERLASELISQAEGGNRDMAWLRAVFLGWAPVLHVVLEELDSVLNSEGSKSDDTKKSS